VPSIAEEMWEAPGNKSLFASFSSEKEDSSFLKKRSKRLLLLVAADRYGIWPDSCVRGLSGAG